MSDQCKHCLIRGDIQTCQKADCFQHENWYALEMIKENERLRFIMRNFMSCLPSHRDWLDPEVEAEVKEILAL